jgi:predicted RNA-binding protein YlxR (DUF448 family)
MRSTVIETASDVARTRMRQCTGCRGRFPQAALQRFVRIRQAGGGPGSQWVPDPMGKKQPGRGVYLCRRAECIKLVEKNKKVPGLAAAASAAGLY